MEWRLHSAVRAGSGLATRKEATRRIMFMLQNMGPYIIAAAVVLILI